MPAESEDLVQDGAMRPYWLSWYSSEPHSSFEMHSPWWVSGYTGDGERTIYVAAVRAQDEALAWDVVRGSYDCLRNNERDPDFTERFIEEVEADWSPFSGRFPQAEWMAWGDDGDCACPVHSGSKETGRG